MSSMCGLNLESRIFDKILYEVDNYYSLFCHLFCELVQ
jgi:hypothetical protein